MLWNMTLIDTNSSRSRYYAPLSILGGVPANLEFQLKEYYAIFLFSNGQAMPYRHCTAISMLTYPIIAQRGILKVSAADGTDFIE